MRKRICCIILCLFAASFAQAAEDRAFIQPFGGLSWEDGLESVVNRLNAMGGIEKIVLGNGIHGHSENVKGKIGKELRELLIKSYGRFEEAGDFANPDLARAKHFRDPTGAKIPFHECQPAEITAWPVTICGVPFEVKIETVYSPGLAYRNPGRVIVVDDGKNPYAISMVLRRVNLTTSSPLLAGRLVEIRRMIIENYGQFKGGLSQDLDSIWGKVGDSRGTILTVDIGNGNGFLSYSSGYFDSLLDEEFVKHSAEQAP